MSERVPGSQPQSPDQLLDERFPQMSSFNYEVGVALKVLLPEDEGAQLELCRRVTFEDMQECARVFSLPIGGRVALRALLTGLIEDYREEADIEHILSPC